MARGPESITASVCVRGVRLRIEGIIFVRVDRSQMVVGGLHLICGVVGALFSSVSRDCAQQNCVHQHIAVHRVRSGGLTCST